METLGTDSVRSWHAFSAGNAKAQVRVGAGDLARSQLTAESDPQPVEAATNSMSAKSHYCRRHAVVCNDNDDPTVTPAVSPCESCSEMQAEMNASRHLRA